MIVPKWQRCLQWVESETIWSSSPPRTATVGRGPCGSFLNLKIFLRGPLVWSVGLRSLTTGGGVAGTPFWYNLVKFSKLVLFLENIKR